MHDINLGAAIARERRAAQVTQGELAAHLGVTKAAVSKWELEQSMPDVALLPRIAAYFDLTLDELFDYRPQLVGDDLQDAYLRLLAQFDEDPEAAFANAEDLVRSHYSCWPALQQMGMLYAQRATLDPDRAEPLAARAAELSLLLDRNEDAAVPLRKAAAALRDEMSEAKLSQARLDERVSYLERMVTARLNDVERLGEEDRSSRRSLAEKAVVMRRAEPLLQQLEFIAQAARGCVARLESQSTQAQEASSGLYSAVTEARAAAKSAHDAYDEDSGRLSESRVEKGRLEVRLDAVMNAVVHAHGMPLDEALGLPPLTDRDEAEEQAARLRRRIGSMGAINPDAAREYEALKARYDFLQSQMDDLAQARRSLAKIVRIIDDRMRSDFLRTFEEVNGYFGKIFAQLFPGGKAELSLVDPDDVENSGVEVSAQPRGKRVAKMSLLSGGEKSLTALALLFAVYRTRSTPFYILDEVEAALDDSNLRRLTAYLEHLRQTTQLIMITHQRRTMEMADVLFGVSMHADGVTKVISQKLDRALQYAE